MRRWIITDKGWCETDATTIKNDMGLDLFYHKKIYGCAKWLKWEVGDPWVITEGITGTKLFECDTRRECTVEAVKQWMLENKIDIARLNEIKEINRKKIVEKYGEQPTKA